MWPRAWNLLSAAAIGTSYFAIGATNRPAASPLDHQFDIALIWVSTGLVGLLTVFFVRSVVGLKSVVRADTALDVTFASAANGPAADRWAAREFGQSVGGFPAHPMSGATALAQHSCPTREPLDVAPPTPRAAPREWRAWF
eukprot:Selendium_serpulae@DN11027_c0_g1_i1.p3